MKRSLLDPPAIRNLVERIGLLAADARPKWGSLSAPAMVCHLDDAMQVTLRERTVDPVRTRFRGVIRWLALSPIPFPRGRIRAPAGVLPDSGGTAPADFDADRAHLIATLERCAAHLAHGDVPEHPILGPLTAAQWGRFHAKHCDHHLRQFGV